MEQKLELTEPRTDEEIHFIPEWLQKSREEMDKDTEGMTSAEEMAYYRERAAQFREQQDEK